ncbi:hypothetical protein XENORESO_000471 [Xenotaenia resolanae]|uniref:Uncharacterized protein n=1 Tax=Xenotaenia resolanae TaxID=208358 RepID=A0ABV0X5I1_9TELE
MFSSFRRKYFLECFRLFSDQASKPQLHSEARIDSYSTLTWRRGFESKRLTLLWSQSTTGDYFEGKNALSIGFHFRNSGSKMSTTIGGVESMYVGQQNHVPGQAVSKQKGQRLLFKFRNPKVNMTQLLFVFYTPVSWDVANKNVDNTSKDRVLFHLK